MVGLKQTQGQVGVLEDSLARVQLELERVAFSLQAKTSAPVFDLSPLPSSQLENSTGCRPRLCIT